MKAGGEATARERRFGAVAHLGHLAGSLVPFFGSLAARRAGSGDYYRYRMCIRFVRDREGNCR